MAASDISNQSPVACDASGHRQACASTCDALADSEGKGQSTADIHSFAFQTFSTPIHNRTAEPEPTTPECENASDEQLELRIEVGRTWLGVEHIMNLRRGCVIRLDNTSEEPVSVYAGQQLIARGQLVVVDDCFGVKITELVKTQAVERAA